MESQIIQHPGAVEARLAVTGTEAVARARQFTVKTAEDYEAGGEYLREIKRHAKDIADYWAGPKAKAAAAHKEIVAKEKAMLTPLNEAETIIKRTMNDYQRAVEAKRRAEELEIRHRQQEERDRLLAEAMEAEQAGKQLEAETSLAMAAMVEDLTPAPVTQSAPKANGVSVRKTWKARITDPDKVPIAANGVTIRPIDTKALDGIARLTKGTSIIPGVEFYEDSTLAVR